MSGAVCELSSLDRSVTDKKGVILQVSCTIWVKGVNINLLDGVS